MSRQIVLTWDDADWTPDTATEMLDLAADWVGFGCETNRRTYPDSLELVQVKETSEVARHPNRTRQDQECPYLATDVCDVCGWVKETSE